MGVMPRPVVTPICSMVINKILPVNVTLSFLLCPFQSLSLCILLPSFFPYFLFLLSNSVALLNVSQVRGPYVMLVVRFWRVLPSEPHFLLTIPLDIDSCAVQDMMVYWTVYSLIVTYMC